MISLKASSLSALVALMPFRSTGNSSPSQYLHKLLLMLLVWFAFTLPCRAVVESHSISLTTDTPVATDGYFRLRWHGDQAHAQYRLLESDTPLFNHNSVVYQGPDLSTVISDRANGDYYYRVVELQNGTPLTASNTVKVQVRNHDLVQAFLPFAIAAVIILITLVLIFSGRRRRNSGDS